MSKIIFPYGNISFSCSFFLGNPVMWLKQDPPNVCLSNALCSSILNSQKGRCLTSYIRCLSLSVSVKADGGCFTSIILNSVNVISSSCYSFYLTYSQ